MTGTVAAGPADRELVLEPLASASGMPLTGLRLGIPGAG